MAIYVPGFLESVYFSGLPTAPAGLTIDPITGIIYFADQNFSGVLQRLAPDKTISTVTYDFTPGGGSYAFAATDIHFANGFVYSSLTNGELVQIDTNTGASTILKTFPGFSAESGLDINGSKIYVTDGDGYANALWEYDLKTNSATAKVLYLPPNASSVEFDPVHNKVYFADRDSSGFYVADPDTGTHRLISSARPVVGNFAVDPTGEFLYARAYNTIERISIADGSYITFYTGLSNDHFGDLDFGSSSSGSGSSLYVTDGNNIIEISGFPRLSDEPKPNTIFSEDFSDNSAGWTMGPEWQIGSATASSGQHEGNPDPSTDNTSTADNGVAGVVIGGNASTSMHGYYYLTSPVVNTNVTGSVSLEFSRWLNSYYSSYMQNVVEVYDGFNWMPIWQNYGPPVQDSAWTPQSFDITPYKNANLQVRFGFQIENSNLLNVSSWNIDDFRIFRDPKLNNVPDTQFSLEDAPLTFHSQSWNNNQISINNDPSTGPSPIQVTLQATNGTLSLPSTGWLDFSKGDGREDTTITFSGFVGDINNVLNGLQFKPTVNFNGTASIQITTNVPDNAVPGGFLSDTDTVNITVHPVNDAPLIAATPLNENFDSYFPSPISPALTINNGSISSYSPGSNYSSGNDYCLRFDYGDRHVTTIPMNVAGGGTISFSLVMGSGTGIVLEYSVDEGASWNQIENYVGYYNNSPTQTLPIPTAAQTSATQFRWRQVQNGNYGSDSWALDDMVISSTAAPRIPDQNAFERMF